MIKEQVYHRDVYWPKEVNAWLLNGNYKVKYTDHAKKARYDAYTKIPTLNWLFVNKNDIIEYYPENKKFTYRFNLDAKFDITMVLMQLENGVVTVITQWVNEIDDKHETLDKDKYVQNPNTEV